MTEETTVHRRFIVLGTDEFGGHYGYGATLSEAERNYKKNGGKVTQIVHRDMFVSDKPFAPTSRDATNDEADAYVGGYGSMCWIRCTRHQLDDAEAQPWAAGV